MQCPVRVLLLVVRLCTGAGACSACSAASRVRGKAESNQVLLGGHCPHKFVCVPRSAIGIAETGSAIRHPTAAVLIKVGHQVAGCSDGARGARVVAVSVSHQSNRSGESTCCCASLGLALRMVHQASLTSNRRCTCRGQHTIRTRNSTHLGQARYRGCRPGWPASGQLPAQRTQWRAAQCGVSPVPHG